MHIYFVKNLRVLKHFFMCNERIYARIICEMFSGNRNTLIFIYMTYSKLRKKIIRYICGVLLEVNDRMEMKD